MDKITECFTKCIRNENTVSGYLSTSTTFQTFEKILREKGFSFSVRSSKKFNKNKISVRRKDMMQMQNQIPFCILKKTFYHCSQGKLYYKLQANKLGADHSSLAQKKMRRLKNSKKQECPATMTVYSLDLFVDYAVASDKWREKKEVLSQLRTDLSAEKYVRREKKIYITLSLSHNHPVISTQLNQLLKPVSSDEGDVNLLMEPSCILEVEEITSCILEVEEVTSSGDCSEDCNEIITEVREAVKKVLDITYCLNPYEVEYDDMAEALKLCEEAAQILDRNLKKRHYSTS